MDDSVTWISYGALAAIHYDMDCWSDYWHEPCWKKYEFKPLIISIPKDYDDE
jgi:hypothetical protein